MIKYFFGLAVACLLSGCAATGTKTLYRAAGFEPLRKLGFARLNPGEAVRTHFPQADSIFVAAMKATFGHYAADHVKPIDFPVSPGADGLLLRDLCDRDSLDGVIVASMKFINVTYGVYGIPIAQNWDTEVDMGLYNRKGDLLLAVRHNTFRGNSYLMPPPANRTIYDGTAGAVRRIARELGWTRPAPTR